MAPAIILDSIFFEAAFPIKLPIKKTVSHIFRPTSSDVKTVVSN